MRSAAGSLEQAGHGHHVAADHHHEFGTGRQPHAFSTMARRCAGLGGIAGERVRRLWPRTGKACSPRPVVHRSVCAPPGWGCRSRQTLAPRPSSCSKASRRRGRPGAEEALDIGQLHHAAGQVFGAGAALGPSGGNSPLALPGDAWPGGSARARARCRPAVVQCHHAGQAKHLAHVLHMTFRGWAGHAWGASRSGCSQAAPAAPPCCRSERSVVTTTGHRLRVGLAADDVEELRRSRSAPKPASVIA